MKDLSRRSFIGRLAVCTAAGPLLAAGPPQAAAHGEDGRAEDPYVHEAMEWEALDQKRVRCTLCPRECPVPDHGRGYCGVRENRDGKYYTLVYGRAAALNIDPIEKKPLFHYMPGTRSLSVATAGCNFECKFCQNWNISQRRPEKVRARNWPPVKLVAAAQKSKCHSIAYTYSEPIIFYEYMHDTARSGKKAGIKSVMISNGYIKRKAMKAVCEHLDAVKIDFKAFSEKFYRDVCEGSLKPVLDTIGLVSELKRHLELVVLLIPGLNDREKELKEMAKWIVKNVGRNVPVHFSRFQPRFKMTNHPPTPVKTLETAHDIMAGEGINFVYIGNVPGHKYGNTYCPKCGTVLIERYSCFMMKNVLKDGKCPKCGTAVPGVWK